MATDIALPCLQNASLLIILICPREKSYEAAGVFKDAVIRRPLNELLVK